MAVNDWLHRFRRVEELANDDAEVRANALRHLEIADDDGVVPYLVGCRLEYSSGVAAAARRALSALGDDGAVFLLIDRLEDPKAGWDAAQAIRWFDDPRPLVRHIQDLVVRDFDSSDDYGRRAEAAKALGEAGDPHAIPALIYALDDRETNVRSEAIRALGMLGDNRAVQPLNMVLEHTLSPENTVVAVRALARIRSDAAWLGLIDKLLHLSYSSIAYLEALKVLVEACERRAIPQLLLILDMVAPYHPRTAGALRQLGHTEIFDELLGELNVSDPWERHVAAETRGGFGDVRAVGPLTAALGDDDWEARRSAAWALGQLGDAEAVQALTEILDDEDRCVRLAVVRSLGQLGDERAVPHLSALPKEEDWEVREAARRSIKALEIPPAGSGRPD